MGAYETIRRERSKFLHEVEATTIQQSMFPPGPEQDARNFEMRKLYSTGQHKWDDDAFLGIWGQLCEVWAYDAFDAADDWWVQWGVLRERSMERSTCHEDSSIQLPWSRLEISVSAHTGYVL